MFSKATKGGVTVWACPEVASFGSETREPAKRITMLKPFVFAALTCVAALQPAFANEPKPAGGNEAKPVAEAKPVVEAKPVAEAKPGVEAKPVGRKARAAGGRTGRGSVESKLAVGDKEKPASGVETLIAMHAKANNLPEDLVHRVVMRESRYNPRAVGRGGAMGLMQIKHATARSLGYAGSPAGLLDAETNLTYAVRYLAGAYKVANGDHNRAVSFYARGYYYDAKRKGILPALKAQPLVLEAKAAAAAEPTQTASVRWSLFVPSLTPYLSLDSAK